MSDSLEPLSVLPPLQSRTVQLAELLGRDIRMHMALPVQQPLAMCGPRGRQMVILKTIGQATIATVVDSQRYEDVKPRAVPMGDNRRNRIFTLGIEILNRAGQAPFTGSLERGTLLTPHSANAGAMRIPIGKTMRRRAMKGIRT